MEIRVERFAREREPMIWVIGGSVWTERSSTTYRRFSVLGVSILWAVERVL